MRKKSSEFQRVQLLKGKLLLNEERKEILQFNNESSIIEMRRADDNYEDLDSYVEEQKHKKARHFNESF